MRRTLNIALVVAAIFIKVMVAPSKTVAEMDTAKAHAPNMALINGLHIALPENMTRFPAELLPLP